MMNFCIELNEDSKDLCAIVTPKGKQRYKFLPMGLSISPDIAQSIMEEVLSGLNVEVYIDDITIFSEAYEEHMRMINMVIK